MDYTKYALKSADELKDILADKDNLFVVACNKCFKKFDTVVEPDADEFVRLAEGMGKHITGVQRIDFVCNEVQTKRKLEGLIPEGTDNIAVVSCGLGIQTVAELEDKPVVAATNSLNYIGHHGMALTKKTCGYCAQCYLNVTGGVCPVVDCSKGLLNGQCGGSKNGKCEVDPNKDCAWQKIYERLEKQGRTAEFLNQPVQLRDYSKVKVDEIKKYVADIRDKRFAGYYGGVHPLENKEINREDALVAFPEPDVVVVPTSMHIGAPATPLVQVGDSVRVGQKIAEAPSFISANVHSPVSGTVEAVEERLHTSGRMVVSIVIRNDHKDTIDPSVVPAGPLEDLTPEQIVDIVKEKGITGMGGATFPTYVKLKPGKPIDAVLLNGCECEPYLNADYRMLLEYPDKVVFGVRAIMKAVGAPKGYIVIEDNKPEAVELLKQKVLPYPELEVACVRTKYPQGAEKMIIKNIMHRMVPSGGLPADVGAVVDNVSTAVAIADAIETGMPLVERAVSVTGERIKNPGNYMVKLGTMVKDIVDYCGGITEGGDVTVKLGGPMMGALISDLNVPVIKGTNGVLCIDTDYTEAQDCIKCGRCMDVCPMELAPLNLAKFSDLGDVEGLKANHVMDCFECRSCEWICSSKIPLVAKIRAGKKAVKEAKK